MIVFRDFVAKVLTPEGFMKQPKLEPFDIVVHRANNWIRNEGIKVINVETVVLPNIHSTREEGTGDTYIVAGDASNSWNQFVRVWYETDG
jgi:hypothetical protein